jgi:hypothetical protein
MVYNIKYIHFYCLASLYRLSEGDGSEEWRLETRSQAYLIGTNLRHIPCRMNKKYGDGKRSVLRDAPLGPPPKMGSKFILNNSYRSLLSIQDICSKFHLSSSIGRPHKMSAPLRPRIGPVDSCLQSPIEHPLLNAPLAGSCPELPTEDAAAALEGGAEMVSVSGLAVVGVMAAVVALAVARVTVFVVALAVGQMAVEQKLELGVSARVRVMEERPQRPRVQAGRKTVVVASSLEGSFP